jgi:hypothetical protein
MAERPHMDRVEGVNFEAFLKALLVEECVEVG